jgi:hypothetical protein
LAESEIPPPAKPAKPKRQAKLKAHPEEGSEEFDTLRSQFLTYSAKNSVPPRAAAQEFEGFLSYHRARGNHFADWSAAGQGWIRKSIKFAAERSGQQPGRGPDL